MTSLEQTFGEIARASPRTVDQELDDLWQKLRDDKEARAFAEARGVDVTQLDSLNSNPFASAAAREEDGTGVAEAIAIGIVVTVGSELIMAALKQTWVSVIKPTLVRKYGDRVRDLLEDAD